MDIQGADAVQTITGNTDILAPINEPVVATTPADTDFRSLLSDEFKTHASLQEYKDLNGLAKSHIELQKTLGDRVKLPNEKSTPEEINKFFNKLGRPEEADKYELSNPDNLPDGFEMNEDSIKQFKELAHKAGLTNKQADELRNYYLNDAIEKHKASFVSPEQQEAEFNEKGRQMFGDKYESILQNATKLITENLPEGQRADLDKLSNEKLLAVVSLVNNMNSKFFKPDTIDTSYSQANTLEQSKTELSGLIDKLATMNKFDHEYKPTEERINKLYAGGVKLY